MVVIGGGFCNHVDGASYASILGGSGNIVNDNSHYSAIIGGRDSIIASDVEDAIMIGSSGTNSIDNTTQFGNSLSIYNASGAPPTDANGMLSLQNDRPVLRYADKDWRPRGRFRFVDARAAGPQETEAAASGQATGNAGVGQTFSTFDFDDSSVEYADYIGWLDENYASGGLDFTIVWTPATTPTAGTATVWNIGFRPMSGNHKLSESWTYSAGSTVVSGTGHVAGHIEYATISVAHSALKGWGAGMLGTLRMRRHASNSNDNMSGDAKLISVQAIETI